MQKVILIIGANGQLGSVLTKALRNKFGKTNVIASDIYPNSYDDGIYEIIDAMNKERIQEVVTKYEVTEIYHLAAILSAKGEQNPINTWDINVITLLNVLEISRKNSIDKVFFPSSIAVFGENVLRNNTSNHSCLNPYTVYGITKATGENWAQYYYERYGLDVRSLRYPGVIGYQSDPGGGTTDYAIDIFHRAVKEEKFSCFLDKNTCLPMIYMDDAIRATLELMEVPKENIKIRTSYNLSGISFSPVEIVNSIRKYYPNFEVSYKPDFRQGIADKWPNVIDDSEAKLDWGWSPEFDLKRITKSMIENLQQRYNLLATAV